MTDIQTAIKELREAIDRGATWDMISRAYDVLNNALVERHKPFQTLTKELLFSAPVKWDKVAAALTALESAVGEGVGDIEKLAAQVHLVYCEQYEKKHGKPYWTDGDYSQLDEATKDFDRAIVRWHLSLPTPDLTARIEAAAEEITTMVLAELPEPRPNETITIPLITIAAIIRRHLEGGK